MKRAFEAKWKIFLLVSKVLSFRDIKQTSENVTDNLQVFFIFMWGNAYLANYIANIIANN